MKSPAWLFALSVVSAIAQVPPSRSHDEGGITRYSILIAGHKVGLETSSRDADGRLRLDWEYSDRGWGPKVHEEIVLDERGVPIRLESSGNNYLKAPVREHFAIGGGRARWKSGAEEGEAALSGKAFYLSVSGTPEETAVLARALIAAGGRLPLLPAGEAAIEKRGDLKLEAQGRSRTVVHYAITGLDFTPSSLWLDPDGRFFAIVNESRLTVVREGWESAVLALASAQDEYSDRRSAQLAERLAHRPAGPLAFVHAALFDSAAATVRPGSTVLIRGKRIAAVGLDGTIAFPPGTEVVDAAGRILMPGLWDMHAHLQPEDGLLDLAVGVTSVRDLANDTEHVLRMRDRFDQGTEIGPRVLMAGVLDGRGPYTGPTDVVADSEQEARDAIDRYAKLGYAEIKIGSSVKPMLVPKIVQMAKRHGLRVSGDVPAFMNARQLVRDGADEIHNMAFIFLNSMPDIEDTRTPACFAAIAARGGQIGVDSGPVNELIRTFREHMTVVDPTLSSLEQMFTARHGELAPRFAAVARRLPARVRRDSLCGGLDVPAGMDARHRASFRQMLKVTKAVSDAGVRIVPGSDSLAGFSLHRELELYEQAGIPASRILQLATLGAARVMKRDYWYGSIAPGKFADVVLVDGDPSRRISDIRRVMTVVKDGTVYQASELYQALGVAP